MNKFEDLRKELDYEKLKYFRRKNREWEIERHNEAMNEALRKLGYPVLYKKKRGW